MHQDNPIKTKGGFLEINVAKNHLKKTCTWLRAQIMMLHALLQAIAFSNRPQHWRLDALLKSNYREISEMACSPGNPKDSCSSKRGTEQYYLKLHNEASQAGVRLGMAQWGKKPNDVCLHKLRGHGKKASEYFPSSLNALCRHIPCSDVYHYESTDSKCIKMCWALKINVCNCVYIDLQTATAAFITGINIVFFILNGCWLICKKQPEIISCWELVIFMNMKPCLRWQNWEKVNFMQQCKVSLLYS